MSNKKRLIEAIVKHENSKAVEAVSKGDVYWSPMSDNGEQAELLGRLMRAGLLSADVFADTVNNMAALLSYLLHETPLTDGVREELERHAQDMGHPPEKVSSGQASNREIQHVLTLSSALAMDMALDLALSARLRNTALKRRDLPRVMQRHITSSDEETVAGLSRRATKGDRAALDLLKRHGLSKDAHLDSTDDAVSQSEKLVDFVHRHLARKLRYPSAGDDYERPNSGRLNKELDLYRIKEGLPPTVNILDYFLRDIIAAHNIQFAASEQNDGTRSQLAARQDIEHLLIQLVKEVVENAYQSGEAESREELVLSPLPSSSNGRPSLAQKPVIFRRKRTARATVRPRNDEVSAHDNKAERQDTGNISEQMKHAKDLPDLVKILVRQQIDKSRDAGG